MGNKMVGLLLTPQGAYKIPECEKCGSRMIPKDMVPENGVWKCPYCINEQENK